MYNSKKEPVKNPDLKQTNGKPMIQIDHDDYDDQDIYISERSSVASSNDMNQTSSPITKRLPTPTPSPPLLLSQRQHPTLRYQHHDLPENGTPIVSQYQLQHKEDRHKKKSLLLTTSNQGALASFPESKPSEVSNNHYPYWYYYKMKNPDWNAHNRQTSDGQMLPYESFDTSQHAQPALTTSPIKPKQQPIKSRQNGASLLRSNQDKQRYDSNDKNSPTSSYLTFYESHDNNRQQQQQTVSPSKQHVPPENVDNDEHREQLPKRKVSRQGRKQRAENDSTDHHVQSIASKPPQNSSSLIITSNSLTSRQKNRSKVSEKSLVSDTEDNHKYRLQKPSHHHHNQTQPHIAPSIPSQQNYHHNHYQSFHVRRRPPSGSYISSDFQTVEGSTKKPERTSYFQQVRESFHSQASSIYNPNIYLPPIIRDCHHQKQNTTRFPTEYYGTLARQTHGKEWEEPIEIPKIYKPDPQTRFYDRYLNSVVDKRLAA